MRFLAIPDGLRDVHALQANVGQKAVIKLPQLALGAAAGHIALDRAHQAGCGGKAAVASRFAAHADRRHLSFSVRKGAAGLPLRRKNCALHSYDAHLGGRYCLNKRHADLLDMRYSHISVHLALSFTKIKVKALLIVIYEDFPTSLWRLVGDVARISCVVFRFYVSKTPHYSTGACKLRNS
jgi:hypothetical protein